MCTWCKNGTQTWWWRCNCKGRSEASCQILFYPVLWLRENCKYIREFYFQNSVVTLTRSQMKCKVRPPKSEDQTLQGDINKSSMRFAISCAGGGGKGQAWAWEGCRTGTDGRGPGAGGGCLWVCIQFPSHTLLHCHLRGVSHSHHGQWHNIPGQPIRRG